MATPDEIRLLLNMKDDDEKPLKEALLEQLAGREAPKGSEVRCEWCGHFYTKERATQIYCKTACKVEFHMYAKRFLRGVQTKIDRSLA